uniref:flagellar cap protein FliD N-terminal domain-containing protein n=1 Tax=uncultured Campylobacter sp. TaxID=218934 RepID=UPI0025E213FC
MALGNVTNLGLSSSRSMLNEDLVKKLKEADEAGQIRPLNKKLDKNKARSEDLGALKTLVSNVNVSAKKLNDENLYLKRSINTTGKSASMTVSSGVSLQNFTLDVTQLAQRD